MYPGAVKEDGPRTLATRFAVIQWVYWNTGVDSEEARGGAPSGLTLKGAKYVWPQRFLADNAHSALKVNTWSEIQDGEIEPECGENLFLFGLHLNLGAKFHNSGLKKNY